MMKIIPVQVLLILWFIAVGTQAQTAYDVLDECLDNFGGYEQLKSTTYIKKHYNGHKHWLEQSEFHNGPFITSYEDVTETYALGEDKLYQEVNVKQFQFEKFIDSKIIINEDKADMIYGEKNYPMPKSYKDEILGIVDYDPIKLLLKAKNSNNLTINNEATIIEGNAYDVLNFTLNKLSYHLYINKITSLLYQAVVETYLPYENFFSPFGNFDTTIKYSLYHYYPKGIRYPVQWDIYRLNEKWRSITCDKVEFLEDVDTSIFDAKKTIPNFPKVTEQKGNFKFIKELYDNVFVLQAQWFVHWVIQDDGIIILEAPISSSYSKSIIAYLRKTYPKKPIKGVVIASDAYPHLAGIREYVANEIPIYIHKNNKELIESIINANYKSDQDSQSKVNNKPIYKFVNSKTTINSTTESINIYPINGSAGSKMLMVELEKSNWLYAADLVQKLGDGSFFMPQYLTEINNALKLNNIRIEKVSAMHAMPLEWNIIIDFLDTYAQ